MARDENTKSGRRRSHSSDETTISRAGNRRRNGDIQRPERTRQHYIESLSRNHVERFILLRGHTVDEPTPDYGYDIIVNTFDYHDDPDFKKGEIENGMLFIQLKATDTLDVLADGSTVSFPIKRRHAVYWMQEAYPVFLIVYSARDQQAFWLHMQPYLKAKTFVLPSKEQEEITVHLSKQSVLDERAIDLFRQYKTAVLKKIEGLNLYV